MTSVEQVHENIKANLGLFGLENKRVDCYVVNRDGRKEFVCNDLLSVACVSRLYDHPVTKNETGARLDGWLFMVSVWDGDKEIGTIDSDGKFRYHQAPDLRTGLAWCLATDGGTEKVFGPDAVAWLDNHVKNLTNAVIFSLSRDNFHDKWMRGLRNLFSYERGYSRFGDGYCSAATPMWKLATRTILGEEHPGFSFGW